MGTVHRPALCWVVVVVAVAVAVAAVVLTPEEHVSGVALVVRGEAEEHIGHTGVGLEQGQWREWHAASLASILRDLRFYTEGKLTVGAAPRKRRACELN